jgi:hypothetical protein
MTMTTYLCIGPNCWGKGELVVGEMTSAAAKAVANCRKNLPSWERNRSKGGREMEYDLWLVPESCEVGELGGIRWKREEGEPVLVRRVRKVDGKLVTTEVGLPVSQLGKGHS